MLSQPYGFFTCVTSSNEILGVLSQALPLSWATSDGLNPRTCRLDLYWAMLLACRAGIWRCQTGNQ